MTKALRDAAKAAGLIRYFTGRPCVHGHVAERFVSSRNCVVCACERAVKWKKANPAKCAEARRRWVAENQERNKAIKSAWNKANPEGQAARSRKWFLSNKERANAQAKAYRERTPAMQNAKAAKRRSAKLQATPSWADLDWIADFYTLARIYRDAGYPADVDHVIPLRGRKARGLHVPFNLSVVPPSVNRSKGAKLALEH